MNLPLLDVLTPQRLPLRLFLLIDEPLLGKADALLQSRRRLTLVPFGESGDRQSAADGWFAKDVGLCGEEN